MRLIDAIALENDNRNIFEDEYGLPVAYVLVEDIRRAPTVGAVEVVRCKDCKWYKEGRILKGKKFCFRLKHPQEDRRIGYNFSPDDFCSYGERKEK